MLHSKDNDINKIKEFLRRESALQCAFEEKLKKRNEIQGLNTVSRYVFRDHIDLIQPDPTRILKQPCRSVSEHPVKFTQQSQVHLLRRSKIVQLGNS